MSRVGVKDASTTQPMSATVKAHQHRIRALPRTCTAFPRPAADAACGRAFLPQAERRIFLHRGRPPYISYFSFGKIRLMSAIAATVIRHSTTPMAAPMPTFVPDATAFELMDVPKIWSYI